MIKARPHKVIEVRSLLDERDYSALMGLLAGITKIPMLVVEVGAGKGGTTVGLAREIYNHVGYVFSIDLWPDRKDYEKMIGIAKAIGNVIPLWMSSVQAMRLFADGLFDFIFIDADHKYSSVKEDIEGWMPKVKKGGILAGHDCEGYYSNYPLALREDIDAHLEDENTSFECHPGVIKSLHDIFKDDYSICPDTRVWYKHMV